MDRANPPRRYSSLHHRWHHAVNLWRSTKVWSRWWCPLTASQPDRHLHDVIRHDIRRRMVALVDRETRHRHEIAPQLHPREIPASHSMRGVSVPASPTRLHVDLLLHPVLKFRSCFWNFCYKIGAYVWYANDCSCNCYCGRLAEHCRALEVSRIHGYDVIGLAFYAYYLSSLYGVSGILHGMYSSC